MACPLMTSSGEYLKSQIYISHPLQDSAGVSVAYSFEICCSVIFLLLLLLFMFPIYFTLTHFSG